MPKALCRARTANSSSPPRAPCTANEKPLVRGMLRAGTTSRINKVKRDDVDVAEYLKASNPELYKTLKKEARAKKKERVAH